MREYIEGICRELDFPAEAKAVMLDAWERVSGNSQAMEIWQRWLTAYRQDVHMDYRTMLAEIDEAGRLAGVHRYTAELLIFLCLTERLLELYEQKGIDLQIWHDSCMDMRWKLRECWENYGIWGSFVAHWFPGFFELERFALGRLQFELVDFPAEYERTGKTKPEGMSGDMGKAINVHIPSCGKLDMEVCHASYRQAAEFFADAFPGGTVAFVCDSWLLFPPHREMLGEKSGIVRFMSEYEILKTRQGDGDLWRIFGQRDFAHPETLPEGTGLQRAYKARLCAGEPVGTALGIFFYSKETA